MAYEDITLTTSDNVKIKAYMIPARKNVLSKSEMMSMSATQREEAGEKAMAEWNKEKINDDALEVSHLSLDGDTSGTEDSTQKVDRLWSFFMLMPVREAYAACRVGLT
jgi:hypothetical protein